MPALFSLADRQTSVRAPLWPDSRQARRHMPMIHQQNISCLRQRMTLCRVSLRREMRAFNQAVFFSLKLPCSSVPLDLWTFLLALILFCACWWSPGRSCRFQSRSPTAALDPESMSSETNPFPITPDYVSVERLTESVFVFSSYILPASPSDVY